MSDSRGFFINRCLSSFSVRVHKLEQLLYSKIEYKHRVRNTYTVIIGKRVFFVNFSSFLILNTKFEI